MFLISSLRVLDFEFLKMVIFYKYCYIFFKVLFYMIILYNKFKIFVKYVVYKESYIIFII